MNAWLRGNGWRLLVFEFGLEGSQTFPSDQTGPADKVIDEIIRVTAIGIP